MGANSPTYAGQVALHLGSYAELVAHRTTERLGEPAQGAMVMLWETMGLMLTGMALFRAQMLPGAWHAARYRQWAVACFALGADRQHVSSGEGVSVRLHHGCRRHYKTKHKTQTNFY